MTITTSNEIGDLSTALSKAQAVMAGAKKDSENPHFRSKYADLASVWDACRKALTDNGLSVVQSPRLIMLPESLMCVEVETRLLHTSGQWIADTIAIPVTKVDAHGVGSAITYGRRYALSAFVGVAPEEDDANAAALAGQAMAAQPVKKLEKPDHFDDWFHDLNSTVDNGWDAIVKAWKASPPEMRTYVLSTPELLKRWEVMKASAKDITARDEGAPTGATR